MDDVNLRAVGGGPLIGNRLVRAVEGNRRVHLVPNCVAQRNRSGPGMIDVEGVSLAVAIRPIVVAVVDDGVTAAEPLPCRTHLLVLVLGPD